MNYIIAKRFGPGSDGWEGYATFSGLSHCREFYSIDGMLRENLFTPVTADDWNHCLLNDCKTSILTDLAYARKTVKDFPGAEIVGVIENPKASPTVIPDGHVLRGYDIPDGYNDISLLTNWGGKETVRGLGIALNQYALLEDIEEAYRLKDKIGRDFSDDDRAKGCEVWAIYKLQ